jgi:hypothetical protein
MTDSEKQAWEKVRAEGRDRFLLKSIARAPWILVSGALVELCWWFFTGKASGSVWLMGIKWILLGVSFFALGGRYEWNTKERDYAESQPSPDQRRQD